MSGIKDRKPDIEMLWDIICRFLLLIIVIRLMGSCWKGPRLLVLVLCIFALVSIFPVSTEFASFFFTIRLLR